MQQASSGPSSGPSSGLFIQSTRVIGIQVKMFNSFQVTKWANSDLVAVERQVRQGEVGCDGGVLRVGVLDGGLPLERVRGRGVVHIVHVFIGQIEERCRRGKRQRGKRRRGDRRWHHRARQRRPRPG